MDRVSFLETYFVYACDWGEYETVTRIENMGFRPSPSLKYSNLTEDQKHLYAQIEAKHQVEYGDFNLLENKK
jgi:hypothetical protein